MKVVLSALLLLLPSLATAGPLGFAIRVGPVWRDVIDSRLQVTGPTCHRVYSIKEDKELESDLAATIAPSLRLYRSGSNSDINLVGAATHFFNADQNQYAVQLEYRFGGDTKPTAVENNYKSDAYERQSASEHNMLHLEHQQILENQARQREQLESLQARPVPKPCETVVLRDNPPAPVYHGPVKHYRHRKPCPCKSRKSNGPR